MHYQCLVNDWEEIKRWLPIDFDRAPTRSPPLKSFSSKTLEASQGAGEADLPSVSGYRDSRWRTDPRSCSPSWSSINPEVLGPFPKFDRTFIERDRWGKPKKYKNLALIAERLGPAMYRKSREDISEWLPDLIELEMPVTLDPQRWHLHEYIRRICRLAIEAGARRPALAVASTWPLTTAAAQSMDCQGADGSGHVAHARHADAVELHPRLLRLQRRALR